MSKLVDNIWWVGHIDWDLRNFHGYSTPYGSTYNSYLILDEKPTLVDTVKHCGIEQMLSGIKEVIDPSKIKYIISNHTEMDHSGGITKLLEYCPQAEVVCSPKGQQGLAKHFKADFKFKIVEDGENINIGKRDLKFFLTPMVHWPDSMATYSVSDKILFSNDAFGQHYASLERFADEISLDVVLEEAAKYYANIVLPYGAQVLKALEALSSIKIDGIYPSHGLIWRRKEGIEKILNLYHKWANYESEKKVVIIYDTMWHSTEKIAKKISELVRHEDINVKLIDLGASDPSDIITDIMNSKVVGIGGPILNNNIFPALAGFLTYLKGLKPKKRFGFTFGSYGWSKSGFKELEDSLGEAGIELLDQGKYFQYVPDEQELESLKGLAVKIKEVLKA